MQPGEPSTVANAVNMYIIKIERDIGALLLTMVTRGSQIIVGTVLLDT